MAADLGSAGDELAKVEHFMGVTQMTDPEVCTRILEAHGWNLEAAVHTALGMGDLRADNDEALARQLQHDEGARAVAAPPRGFAAGGAAGPRVQGVQLPGLFRVPVLLLRGVSSVLTLGVRVAAGVLHAVLPGPLRGFALSLLRALQRPVLSPVEAATAFVAAFEERHGVPHPDFVIGSYREALTMANRDFKFLLVYLHSPEHQETPAFCRNTLCAPAVVEYLRENYLVWGGDIRHQDAFQLSGALRATTYPFLAVLANHNSRVTLLTYVEGDVNPGELLTTLSNVLDQQGAMLVAARAEVEERNFNRRLREEQDREFEESLAADRAREESLAAAEEAERAAAAEQQQVAAAAQQAAEAEAARAEEAAAVTTARREAKMAALRAEPAAGPGVTTLLVRMPDGSRQPRRFNLTDSVKAVYDFVDTLDSLTCVRYSLATTFPKRVYGADTHETSIEEAGLKDAMLLVQAEDD